MIEQKKKRYEKELISRKIVVSNTPSIVFTTQTFLAEEGYILTIDTDQINIQSKTKRGELWAIKTLKQLLYQYKDEIPACVIEDEPSLKVRGYMLDVSRSKIPKLQTLFGYIDLLSDIKMNHFELYIEGFSYRYPSFESSIYEHLEPLTEKDYHDLERYCEKKGIDFVLNHNTFGHMNSWLNLNEYRDLAIMKDGMMMWGWHQSASTLNPLKSESISFIKKLIDDAVKGSKNPYFNICFDEAYELGHGPTEKICQEKGIEHVFIEYLNVIVNHLKAYKKKTLMWGDFFIHHPEALKMLPEDVTVIDWGYDASYPFHETLKKLHENHIPFLSAPGTSSWNSISGRTYDMLENVKQAILHTKKYHGLGTILTDWGDNGHLQYPVISLPAIVYTAFESWSDQTNLIGLVPSYLDDFIFLDSTKQLGHLTLDIGRYQRYQKVITHNGTELMQVLQAMQRCALSDNPWETVKEETKHLHYAMHILKKMKNEYEWMKKTVTNVHSFKQVEKIYIDELMGSINHVLLAIDMLIQVRLSTNQLPKSYLKLTSAHERLWKTKNRTPGLEHSLGLLKSMEAFM
jgi:hypothetical protein